MSLSQKHVGKVLVPWFNHAEWQHVYNLIYSEYSPNWPAALEILKIWKHRTPLLSAGVEGTLIILEAIMVKTDGLTYNETNHILSTSLVRFLNLCGANGDKQRTFFKKAKENELPKWLVTIRHDIAHGHQVPSQSMLNLSLKFCLNWLKEKYWDVQGELMSNFQAGEVSNTIVEDFVAIYNHIINIGILENNTELWKHVNKLIKSQSSSRDIMENLDAALREEINLSGKKSKDKLSSLLVEILILSIECEIDEKGNKNIPSSVLNKWQSILQMINQCDIVPDFVQSLFNLTCDEKYTLAQREVASLCMKEIFKIFINQEETALATNSSESYKSLSTQVLQKVHPFSMNFVKEILQYNKAPLQFIEDSLSLISALNTQNESRNTRIFTVEDLDLDITMDICDTSKMNMEVTVSSNSRWIPIKDVTSFRNLPLGVLPNQDRNMNPLFAV